MQSCLFGLASVIVKKGDKAAKGLERYGKQLRELGWFRQVERKLSSDLIALYNCLKGGCGKVEVDLFSQVTALG